MNHSEVAALECRVLVAELACGDNLSGFHTHRVTRIGYYLLAPDAVVLVHKLALIHNLLLKEASVARIYDIHLAHHLANDYLKVLVVDLHTLQTVNVLNLVHNVILNGSRALDIKDISRCNSTIRERCTGANEVVLLNKNLLRERNEIVLHLSELRCHLNLAVTTLNLAEGNLTIDFAHDCGVRRIACLKQLGYTRQTTGDIAGASCCTRNLHEYLTLLDFFSLIYHKVSVHRQ